ncbi:hypothetical protein MTO96_033035 [Rhipicephalus appendiculatus]
MVQEVSVTVVLDMVASDTVVSDTEAVMVALVTVALVTVAWVTEVRATVVWVTAVSAMEVVLATVVATSPATVLPLGACREDTRAALVESTRGAAGYGGGALFSKVNSYNNKQGYSHSSGFSASDSKSFGSGLKKVSAGFGSGAGGLQGGIRTRRCTDKASATATAVDTTAKGG